MSKNDQEMQKAGGGTKRQSFFPPRTQRILNVGVLAVLLICAIVAPFRVTGYWVRVLTGMFMYAALASSLNIILGYTGYADFGNIVYFGMGAYVTGVLMVRLHVPLPLAMLAGGLFCSLFAAVIGLPILRLKGNYFAIATLGLSQAMREIVRNMSITGGGMGLSLPLLRVAPKTFNLIVYFMMFGIMAGVVIISYLVSHSRFGYGLRAIKADENGAAVMGIDTTQWKIRAWAITAFCTGIVGGAYAFWFVYFTPPDVFEILISTKYLVMVYLGGIGTVWGPVIGAFLLSLLSDYVWGRFAGIHVGVLGAAIVLIVLFMPKGFMHMVRTRILPLVSRMGAGPERS